MKDVTNKPETLRTATAETHVSAPTSVLDLVRSGRTEKGDALEIARVAAVMAAKRTPELIPFCHSVPLTHVDVALDVRDDGVAVTVTATAIGPTGVEMEALTGASVAALTLYDMMKPHADDIEIGPTRLVSKRGGKGDFRPRPARPVSAAVIVLSDRVARGEAEDSSGKAIVALLEAEPGVDVRGYDVLPDNPGDLRRAVTEAVGDGIDLVLTVGGTGLSARDRTPEALRELIDQDVPGISETLRAHGQRRTRFAMLSRGVAGFVGDTLVVAYPGSTRGAVESHQALFPALLHAFEVRRGQPHPRGRG